MPDLGISEIAATVATFAAEGAGFSAEVYAVVNAAVTYSLYAGMMYGLGAAAQALTEKPPSGMVASRLQMIKAATVSRKIIYGQVRTSGALVFANTTGNNNEHLHLVVALAGHQCEEIGTIYFDDKPFCDPSLFASPAWDSTHAYSAGDVVYYIEPYHEHLSAGQVFERTNVIYHVTGELPPLSDANCWKLIGDERYYNKTAVTTTRLDADGNPVVDEYGTVQTVETGAYTYSSLVSINKHLGASYQVADADLIANCPDYWTAAHQLNGICYVYVKLEADAKMWPSGIPNISAVLKGKNDIYDPRTGTYGYTSNWALCVGDYIRTQLGASLAEFDLPVWIASANICDEELLIGYSDSLVFPVTAPYYQPRYSLNGIADTLQKPMDILSAMATQGAGSVVWSSGLHRIFAGAYTAPSWDLDESDLRDSIKVTPRVSKQDLFNSVSGTFCDPRQDWQPTTYMTQTGAPWVEQDGAVITRSMDLPYCTDPYEAQRTALLMLRRSRQGVIVNLPGKFTCLPVTVNSVVTLSIAPLGWNKKEFRVLNWRMASTGGGIDLVMQEESADSYSFDPADLSPVDLAPNTNLPSPWVISAPASITVSDDSASVAVVTNGGTLSTVTTTVSWAAVPGAARYRIQVNGVTKGEVPATETTMRIKGLVAGAAIFGVCALNTLGCGGAYTTTDHSPGDAPSVDVANTASATNSSVVTPTTDGSAISVDASSPDLVTVDISGKAGDRVNVSGTFIANNHSTAWSVIYGVYRGSTQVGFSGYGVTLPASTKVAVPFNFTDTLVADGTFTYKLKVPFNLGTGNISYSDISINALRIR